jgi:DNA (cytosine-5)-methyltransferase 1
LRAGDGGSSRQSLIAVTGVHLTQDPISSEGRTPCLGSTTGSLGVAIPVDLRNAARSSGSGAGTQGDGHREDGVSYGLSATQRAIPGVATETVVRRLTELECERLQGYPDGWTDGQSGSARYRQLGNSVAVPVVEWIARRLIAIDTEAVVA